MIRGTKTCGWESTVPIERRHPPDESTGHGFEPELYLSSLRITKPSLGLRTNSADTCGRGAGDPIYKDYNDRWNSLTTSYCKTVKGEKFRFGKFSQRYLRPCVSPS